MRYNSYFARDRPYLEDCVDPAIVLGFLMYWPKAFAQFTWVDRWPTGLGLALTNSYIYSEMRKYEIMTRTRKNGHTGNSKSAADSNSQRNGLQWVNITLNDEDVQHLSSDDSTLGELAVLFVNLADSGFGVSIKPVSDGESICASVIGSCVDDGRRTAGLSSFADNCRDALLCTLYKFDVYLQGEFRTSSLSNSNNHPRFR